MHAAIALVEATTALQGLLAEAGEPVGHADLCRRAAELGIKQPPIRLDWMERAEVIHVIDGDRVCAGPRPLEDVTAVPDGGGQRKYGAHRHRGRWTCVPYGKRAQAYYARVRDAFSRAEPIALDLGEQYGHAAMSELAIWADEQPERFRAAVEMAATSYPRTRFGTRAVRWRADLFFLERDFAAGYRYLAEHRQLDLGMHAVLSRRAGHPRLGVDQLTGMLNSSSGRAGSSAALADAIDHRIQGRLDAFHDVHGRSVVTRAAWLLEHPQAVADLASGDSTTELDPEVFLDDSLYAPAEVDERDAFAFRGLMGFERPRLDWGRRWPDTAAVNVVVGDWWRRTNRLCENEVRAERGLPGVGEGWVSERALLSQLREAFPTERILGQGRPGWLAPQSLDVWLPERLVGVEYQGEQHSRPVDFFGGEAAFANQVRRDERKRDCCAQAGVTLIEVHPGYHLASVLDQVAAAMGR